MIKRLNLVRVIAAGADDDDGIDGDPSDLVYDLNAIHVGQSEIQQNHIRVLRPHLGDGGGAVVCADCGELRILQRGFDERADGLVVLDNEDSVLLLVYAGFSPSGLSVSALRASSM